MPNFSILLAPSEGKASGGNPFAPDMFDYRTSNTFNYFKVLNPERRQLIDALHAVLQDGKTDLEELFGVKDETLEAAVKANLEIYTAPLMSALDRYSPGVMYQAMDFQGLPTGAQRRLLEEGIIFSGLFGLLRPDDLIPEYRLRMDASIPGIGKVSRFWRETLSRELNETLKGRFVWNLLPKIHEDAWEDDHSYEAMVRVQFQRKVKGELKPVTHDVKPLRGKLVNFIVQETLEDLEAFNEWRHPSGYKMDESLSTYDEQTRTHSITMVKRG
jgi:cytoplasmic iron level regulating protein YaaA (DUF328/UPF0246 family)